MSKTFPVLAILFLGGILAWPLPGHADPQRGGIPAPHIAPGLVGIPALPVPVRVHRWKPVRQTKSCLALSGWKALCWIETERISSGTR
ncbi:hypothetical protein [Acidithiobacillus ferriphilus]|uniref:hypothetical protein n=1 Tax=Acidithiobacillus ferriphilus TaxID=1689834 RepID=UPI001C070929|nr:hypothetical protein [Acidithiobacillus ferriphilus]MBU2853341.1 hypothetical protein [Acidithiobacillus ferriphilus]